MRKAAMLAMGILGGGATAVVPAYLEGGLTLSDVVAAYQPYGAASYAASLVNLAHPGTNDAAKHVSYTEPGWDIALGWTFSRVSQQVLTTGVTPAFEYSMIVKYSDLLTATGSQVLAGSLKITGGVVRFEILFTANLASLRYEYNDLLPTSTVPTSGVLAITKTSGYKNGAVDKAIGATSLTGALPITIGGNNQDGAIMNFINANIQALYIYNKTLTDAQVLAISNRMNNLSF